MLLDVLERIAAEAPDRPVVVGPEGPTTYAACVERAAALAAGLRARGLTRFGIDTPVVADMLALLAASSATGAEACVYPPEMPAGDLAAAFRHDVVVSDHEETAGPAQVVGPDDLLDEAGDAPRAESAPVLILTTGTTGFQRGARHDWARLVASVRHPDPQPGSRWLLAYNLNQFAGVQILLHTLASGATLVAPESRQPQAVLETMRAHGVTHASGTPTFWRLVAGTLDETTAADLPLRQITLGGEVVPQALLDRLGVLFPDARVSQIYGATEFGTAVSVNDGRSGLPLTVLDRGDEADIQIRVVDGEIQMRSRIGMLGYHGEDAADAGWRATGDLVEVSEDRIHFIGRRTEIINVGGAKVHPIMVEDVVAAVPGVAIAAAYARSNPITGQIVALDVVARPGVDTDALEEEIRSACQHLPRAARPRIIRFVAELATMGHKLVRRRGATDDDERTDA